MNFHFYRYFIIELYILGYGKLAIYVNLIYSHPHAMKFLRYLWKVQVESHFHISSCNEKVSWFTSIYKKHMKSKLEYFEHSEGRRYSAANMPPIIFPIMRIRSLRITRIIVRAMAFRQDFIVLCYLYRISNRCDITEHITLLTMR